MLLTCRQALCMCLCVPSLAPLVYTTSSLSCMVDGAVYFCGFLCGVAHDVKRLCSVRAGKLLVIYQGLGKAEIDVGDGTSLQFGSLSGCPDEDPAARHSCVLAQDGTVHACGLNLHNQCGLGPSAGTRIATPTLVASLQGVHITCVAVGASHSLACSDAGAPGMPPCSASVQQDGPILVPLDS